MGGRRLNTCAASALLVYPIRSIRVTLLGARPSGLGGGAVRRCVEPEPVPPALAESLGAPLLTSDARLASAAGLTCRIDLLP